MGIPVDTKKNRKVPKSKETLAEIGGKLSWVWKMIVFSVVLLGFFIFYLVQNSHKQNQVSTTYQDEDVTKIALPTTKVETSAPEKMQRILLEKDKQIDSLKEELGKKEREREKQFRQLKEDFDKFKTRSEREVVQVTRQVEETFNKKLTAAESRLKRIGRTPAIKSKKDAEVALKEQLKLREDGIPKSSPGFQPPIAYKTNRQFQVPGRNISKEVSDVEPKQKVFSKSIEIKGSEQVPIDELVAARVKHEYEENKTAGMLPLGSMIPVVLLTGIDAAASKETKENPQPIMVRVQKDAIVPVVRGAAKYKLKGCFLLGTGWGDASAERVYIEGSKVSCVDPVNKWMVTGDIDGYFVDTDNTLGLRGKPQERDGAKMAKAMAASFFKTVSSVAATTAVGATTNALVPVTGGATSVTTIPNANELFTAAGAQGFGAGLDMLAKKYADDVAQIHSVIPIAGGRKAYLIIKSASRLEWKSYDGKFTNSYTLE